jgi:hypothetical protein
MVYNDLTQAANSVAGTTAMVADLLKSASDYSAGTSRAAALGATSL